eukprot:1718360-Ditylum_brightwellii.AAC.1
MHDSVQEDHKKKEEKEKAGVYETKWVKHQDSAKFKRGHGTQEVYCSSSSEDSSNESLAPWEHLN